MATGNSGNDEDWERTSLKIIVGNRAPKNVLTIFYGDSAKKAIAMSRRIDVFFDVDHRSVPNRIDTTPRPVRGTSTSLGLIRTRSTSAT